MCKQARLQKILQFHGVSRQFGARRLFQGSSFSVHRGETVAVVGPNGSGKSTLLTLAAGADRTDAGTVEHAPGTRVAWLRQAVEAPPDVLVGDRFMTLFPAAIAGRLEHLAGSIVLDLDAALSAEYERLLALLAQPERDSRVREALDAIGITDLATDRPLAALSGGEIAKLALVDALTGDADLLLLDEPTNHLDLHGIRWLEAELARFTGAVVLVSHDRTLIDRLASRLVILPGDGEAPEVFTGTYTGWHEERERRTAEQWSAYGRQQRDERRLREHLTQLESRSRYIENSTINFAIRKKAKKIARRSTTLKHRLERQASAVTRVERPGERPVAIRASFEQGDRSASRLVRLAGASISAGGRTLVADIDLAVERGDHIALVGPNGSGKSTLVRTILGEQTPSAGEVIVAGSARIGYLPQTEALPDQDGSPDVTPLDLIRQQSTLSVAEAGNFLHRVLPGHVQTSIPLIRLSYGERRRLALALLMLRGCNVLLLDEPTNHLDIESCEAVEAALGSYDGVVLAVTHDRTFIAAVATGVWSVEDGRIVERAPEEVT